MLNTKKQHEPEETWAMASEGPEPCENCDSTGLVAGHKCKDCNGKGYYEA